MEIQIFKLIYIVAWPMSFPVVNAGIDRSGSYLELASWLPWRCPFLLITGYLCPSCGLTRSSLAVWNFELAESLHFHFAGPILLFISGIIWLSLLFGNTGLILNRIKTIFSKKTNNIIVGTSLALYIFWGFGRNILHVFS